MRMMRVKMKMTVMRKGDEKFKMKTAQSYLQILENLGKISQQRTSEDSVPCKSKTVRTKKTKMRKKRDGNMS